MFDVGWRGVQARTPDGGAGLGLAVVRAVATAHGGAVHVSNVDGGCRFDVRLPLAPGDAVVGAERPGSPGPPRTAGPRDTPR